MTGEMIVGQAVLIAVVVLVGFVLWEQRVRRVVERPRRCSRHRSVGAKGLCGCGQWVPLGWERCAVCESVKESF